MTNEELFYRLAEPFEAKGVKWRVQASGAKSGKPWVRVIPYLRNRAIMDRLDAVVGVGGWSNRFEPMHAGVICGLSLYVNGQWIIKWDGADMTQIEALKGALSGSMKRAAVQWGIGRYLHDVGEQFAEITENRNDEYLKANAEKHGAALYWKPPVLAPRFLPTVQAPAETAATPQAKPLPRGVTPISAIVPPIAMPSRDVAVENAHAALPISATWVLPGTKSNLMGFGGKKLVEVPREHLAEIRAKLNEQGPKYAGSIEAITEYLEATRPD